MQSDPKHTHGHTHDHSHGHTHDHAHGHTQATSHAVVVGSDDLKSPVRMSVWQRLMYSFLILVVLWLAVFWALRTNG